MEYRITAKPSTLVYPTSKEILGWIHQVLVKLLQTFNITQTYADEYDPWLDILTEAAFAILSTTNRLKGYSLGKIFYGHDMIILIRHTMNW